MQEIELYIKLAKSYNNYDASHVESFLDNDMIYGSQWVFDSINGKSEFLKYFRSKLKTVASSDNPIKAEIGFLNVDLKHNVDFEELFKIKAKPCIKMYQGGEPVAVILIKENNGLIIDIHLCQVPHHSQVSGTNIFPK